MTPEQKDWFEYGKLMCAYKYVKQEEPDSVHLIIPMVWDARKKAYRWNVKHTCENCKHYDKADFAGCYACNSGANWEPID